MNRHRSHDKLAVALDSLRKCVDAAKAKPQDDFNWKNIDGWFIKIEAIIGRDPIPASARAVMIALREQSPSTVKEAAGLARVPVRTAYRTFAWLRARGLVDGMQLTEEGEEALEKMPRRR